MVVVCKSWEDGAELHLLHPILRAVAQDFQEVWREHLGEERLPVVTEVWRPHAETERLYRAAGKEPPAYSVHETLPEPGMPLSGCRGLDFGARDHTGAVVPDVICRRIRHSINRLWQYHSADRYLVCVYHSVSGLHFHLQVRPGNETRLRVGPWNGVLEH